MRLKAFTRWHDLRAGRHEPETRRALARIYWAALVIFLALFSIGCVLYGIWQFTRPLRGVESSAKVAAPQIPLQRSELDAVLQAFEERVRRFEERQAAPASLADPS